jgi:hypothetical protein
MNWLDTETKAILQKEDEPKLAPPKVAEFGLVMLRKGDDERRLVRAICRINDCAEYESLALARRPTPATVNPGLTEAEALWGQFELICCNTIAAFVRSEVLLDQEQQDYLNTVFQRVLLSSEFKSTRIDIREVPATEAGENFMNQFIGGAVREKNRPLEEFSLMVPYKKARLMRHWAARVGAQVECEAFRNSPDERNIFKPNF